MRHGPPYFHGMDLLNKYNMIAAPTQTLMQEGPDKSHVSSVRVILFNFLGTGAVDDFPDLPLAQPELARQGTVVSAVEPGADVPVPGVPLQ